MLELHFSSLHSSIALFAVFKKEFLKSLPEHRNHVSCWNSFLIISSFALTPHLTYDNNVSGHTKGRSIKLFQLWRQPAELCNELN